MKIINGRTGQSSVPTPEEQLLNDEFNKFLLKVKEAFPDFNVRYFLVVSAKDGHLVYLLQSENYAKNEL